MTSNAIHQRPAELLQNLIRFNTTNPPGNERECIEYINGLLKEAGMEPERLEMFNVGASDAPLFVKACTEMTERAKKLGPATCLTAWMMTSR